MKKGNLNLFLILTFFLIVPFSTSYSNSYSYHIQNLDYEDLEESYALRLPDTLNISENNQIVKSFDKMVNSNLIDSYFINNENTVTLNFNPEKDFDSIIITSQGVFLKEKTDSYIVEFNSPSILEKKQNLENELSTVDDKVFGIQSVQQKNEIRNEISTLSTQYLDTLKEEQKDNLGQINNIIQKDDTFNLPVVNFILSILTNFGFTGNVVSENPVVEEQFFTVINGVVISEISKEKVSEIQKLDSVSKVSPNYKVYTFLDDSVPLIQNNISSGNLDEDGNNCTESGKLCLDGTGVKIAIIDTGVDYTHPDLGGCLGPGCRVEGGYDFVNNDEDPMDDHGHGTHCAGTAAGSGILNGVAQGATIYSYKVLDSGGSGTYSDVIGGIERSLDPNQDGDYSDKMDIISLSLGGGGNPDDSVSLAIDRVVNEGVLAVVAAGNSGPWESTIGSPGTARNALTVGAVDKEENLADFSSRGPVIWDGGYLNKPDVLAPGVDICSSRNGEAWEDRLCHDDLHVYLSGTSMATPHVAGMAAVIKQANPDLSSLDLKNIIKISSKDLGYKQNEQGSGIVNLPNALDQNFVLEGDLSFGKGLEIRSKKLKLKNIGIETLSIEIEVNDSFDEEGNSYSVLSSNESFVELLPGQTKVVEFSLNPQNINNDGLFAGNVLFNSGSKNITYSYTFNIYSIINLSFPGNYPYYLIYSEDLRKTYAAQQWDDILGDKASLSVRSGTYTVYALSDYVNPMHPLSYPQKEEFILAKQIFVPKFSEQTLEFSMDDGEIYTFEGRTLSGDSIIHTEWKKGFAAYIGNTNQCGKYSYTDKNTCENNPENYNCYFEGDYYCRDLVLYFTMSQGEPGTYGDKKIYLSNNPSQNVDSEILIKYWGGKYE